MNDLRSAPEALATKVGDDDLGTCRSDPPDYCYDDPAPRIEEADPSMPPTVLP